MAAIQQMLLSIVRGFRSRLRFGGADGSTTFTDDTGKVWTAFGNAQIDTSLGDQRGLFDGASDYITTPHSADLAFGAGNFKISFTQRYASIAGFQTICSKGYTQNLINSWLVQTANGTGRLIFYSIVSGSTTAVATEAGAALAINTDYAIEVERVGTTVTIKRDGVQVASGTTSASYASVSELSIGGGSSTGYNNFWFNGWISNWSIV